MIGPIFHRELLAFSRSLGRGGFIRLVVIYLGLFGMYLPSSIESPDLALLPFVLFPLYMAGPVGIDTIAGERERGTLETLLSSPLAPRDILWGKFLFSVAAGSAFLLLSLLVSLLFRTVRGMPVAEPGAVTVVVLTSLVVSAFSAVTGMHVSVRARSSRAAQQWFAALSAVFFVALGAILKLFADRLLPGLKGAIEGAMANGWESGAVVLSAVLLLVVTGAMLLWLSGRMRILWKLNSFR